MLIINNYEEFASHLGEVLGTSDWLEVPQERINLFADATLDHQWIHVDEAKAKEGPFGQTIVHGYLTLSLLPYLWSQIIEVRNIKNDGQLRHGQDEIRTTRAFRPTDPPDGFVSLHHEPARCVQSRN